MKIIIYTHSGTFHSDEVFTIAAISILYKDNIKVYRTRDNILLNMVKPNPLIFVIDVGGEYDPDNNNFDHHQKNFNICRDNNNYKYSSFGLFWKHYGKNVVDKALNKNNDYSAMISERIDRKLVTFIDRVDNGEIKIDNSTVSITHLISSFNVANEKTNRKSFNSAVNIAKKYLKNIINSQYEFFNSKKEIQNSEIINDSILILTKYVPWKEHVIIDTTFNNIKLVIFPDVSSNNWRISTVPMELGAFPPRLLLPINWAGLRDSELESETKIKGAIFCHNGRFIAATSTKEQAINLALQALQYDNNT